MVWLEWSWRKNKSYTCKLHSLEGWIGSAPKCFLNVMFPISIFVRISHCNLYTYRIYLRTMSHPMERSIHTILHYLVSGKVSALLHYWETNATDYNRVIRALASGMKTCRRRHVMKYVNICHWYQMISQHVIPPLKKTFCSLTNLPVKSWSWTE